MNSQITKTPNVACMLFYGLCAVMYFVDHSLIFTENSMHLENPIGLLNTDVLMEDHRTPNIYAYGKLTGLHHSGNYSYKIDKGPAGR